MPIIFVSSLPFGGGERLARDLARKLGYGFLSREDVVAKANESGVPVGKLEVAMVKKPGAQDRLARLRDRYLAVATAVIAEKASEGNIVYYGRAGHLLLPGVAHVVRVRVLPEAGQRLETAMERLRLSREKALTFLEEVDGDIASWVRFVHGVSVDDLSIYDVVFNLENISIENAATALCGIAELPDFRPTPASLRVMADRLLTARARIRLILDERTADADLTVRAADGVLTITYVPQQAKIAPVIPEVLADLPDCREIRCTMAGTNILWIEEEFDAGGETFRQVNELARRWGAAVELIRFAPEGGPEALPAVESAPSAPSFSAATGGIEEDVVERAEPSLDGFRRTLEAFVREGRSGGGQVVGGSREKLAAAISPAIPYSLVVVGGLYRAKPAAARIRMTRDIIQFLSAGMKAPVVPEADLGAKLRFSPGQAMGALAALIGVVVLFVFVFVRQESILDILGGPAHKARPWEAPLLVALLAPIMAALYGKVAGAFLKIFKLE
jgi:cytidylate kinase